MPLLIVTLFAVLVYIWVEHSSALDEARFEGSDAERTAWLRGDLERVDERTARVVRSVNSQ